MHIIVDYTQYTHDDNDDLHGFNFSMLNVIVMPASSAMALTSAGQTIDQSVAMNRQSS